MAASEFNPASLPEWYRIERETEKTINKLTNLKELDYYLGNPDDNIRRLAILRLQKNPAKESAYVLRELLEDAVETDQNKLLASWALTTIVSRKDSDLYTSSKYVGKFSGDERFEDLFPVLTGEISPSVRFDFSSSTSFASLKLDSSDTSLERDVFFETDFDFKHWFSYFSSNLLKAVSSVLTTTGSLLVGMPVKILKSIPAAFRKLLQIHQSKREGKAEKRKARNAEMAAKPEKTPRNKPAKIHRHRKEPENRYPLRTEYASDYAALRKEMAKRPGILSLVKKGVFQLLYFLFAPFRFIRRYKLALLCFIAAAYILLAYTEIGRAFSYKYFAVDLRNVPGIALTKARQYSSSILSGLNKLAGVDEYRKKNPNEGSKDIIQASADAIKKAASEGRLFLVTAQKGLNMRKSPDPGSEKIGSDPLPYGSTVIFLSKSESDDAGRTWYYVEAGDGRAGWVSAKFLKEKEG